MAATLVAPGSKDVSLTGKQEFVIDSYSDLSPGNAQTKAAAVGSVAYIVNTGVVYMKKNDGTWAEFGGGA